MVIPIYYQNVGDPAPRRGSAASTGGSPSGSSRGHECRCHAGSRGAHADVARRPALNGKPKQPVERLYVARWTSEICIIDIALLPEFCGRGIGTMFIRELQAEAQSSNRPLRIHVERFNPARRLYERLGFREIEDKGVYLYMEWR
jgi:ribosomal protein S18 acetylase RimI-like enzyme